MYSLCVLVSAFVAIRGLVAAAPADSADGFSVIRSRNPSYQADGFASMRKTRLKYGKSMPSHDKLVAAAARSKIRTIDKLVDKRWTGHVVTSPIANDTEYLTEVHIGTPAQKFFLDFDTGSSDLWVFSTETSPDQVNGQRLYNPKKSQSAKKLDGATWEIEYQDGSNCSGDVWIDNISIGGLRLKGQAIESAQYVSPQFTDDVLDGLVGLAFSSLNTVQPTPQLTFLNTAKGHIKEMLFTANLNHHADGTYRFGYIEKSEHKGPVTYTPVDSSEGWWAFWTPSYSWGDTPFQDDPIYGIADTGTTLIYITDDITASYYDTVPGSLLDVEEWAYLYPCNATLPDFSFKIEESIVTLPGSYLDYAQVSTVDGVPYCLGGIQSSLVFNDFNIWGDMAFKSSLVVFDQGNMRLGFAPK